MTDATRDYLDFAVETAWKAGRLTLGYFQSGLQPDRKADESPVTIADRESEELVRRRIKERYPGQAIVGEEFGADETGASHRWFIDPIDGTRAFVRGVPLYSVLLGLEVEGQVQVGVAYFPALDELICAAAGLGCWWNGRRARVSDVSRLADGLLTHSDAATFSRHGRGEAWERLKASVSYRAGWADAYGYLLVATGRAELMLDPIMSAWDCAPWPVILGEAGGYFGDWQGNVSIHAGEAMATTSRLLPEVLQQISGG